MARLRVRALLAALPPAAVLVSLAFFAVLGVPAMAARPAPAGDGFVIVVNADNPLPSMPAGELAKMFLQKLTRWKHGERVMPVDLPEDSPVREAFSHAIHDRSTAAIKAYWQKMIFSGRGVPPPEKASASEVLAFVRANPGGLGYVAAGTPLPDGVRVLRVAP